MSIVPAQKINQNWVTPFFHRSKSNGMTYGLGAAGYDIRIAQTIWLWPGVMRLASSIEYFDIPDNILARVCDKSSWARRGVFVQNTVIEPGWKGYLTLELTRGLPWPVQIEIGTPIAQIIFERLEEPTYYPYSGKYQNQRRGPQPAIME